MQKRPRFPERQREPRLTPSQKIALTKLARLRRYKVNRTIALRFAGQVAVDYAKADGDNPFALTLFALLELRFQKPSMRDALGFPPLPDEDSPS